METLQDILDLKQIEDLVFEGQNHLTTWGVVFGGQVLAQALVAAGNTVSSDRKAHSLHAYFILPGRLDTPVRYHVDPIRDGKSFHTRRVVALQNDRAIFNLSCSFQAEESGFEHQHPMPEVPHYSELKTDKEWVEEYKDEFPELFKAYMNRSYVEFRPVEFAYLSQGKPASPNREIWIRISQDLPNNNLIHKASLAFASDYNLMSTSAFPHIGKFKREDMQFASLDHAMWFHKELRADEWLLYSIESSSASGNRGFSTGRFFTEGGELVASVAQEGLMRHRKRKT